MRPESETRGTAEQVVKNICRATRKHHEAEEKIRIVLEGLRSEYSIAELSRREVSPHSTSIAVRHDLEPVPKQPDYRLPRRRAGHPIRQFNLGVREICDG